MSEIDLLHKKIEKKLDELEREPDKDMKNISRLLLYNEINTLKRVGRWIVEIQDKNIEDYYLEKKEKGEIYD